MEVKLLVKVFKERDVYIAKIIGLGLATYGSSIEEALDNAKKLVRWYLKLFLEKINNIKDGYITTIKEMIWAT